MVHEFAYPVVLTPAESEGGFIVTSPDLPEVVTQGEDTADALEEAADALEEAIAGRIRRGDPIPRPSTTANSQQVPVPALTAAKAALYLALRETGISKSELAARLGCDEGVAPASRSSPSLKTAENRKGLVGSRQESGGTAGR